MKFTDGGMNQRILGIDPGLNVTGYGVLEFHGPAEIALVEAGVLRGGTAKKPLGRRLLELHEGLLEVIGTLRPRVVAMEELYSHYDRPRTAILMGHARGVLCLAAASAGLSTHHYSATQVKRVLTGNGRAPKSQMQAAVASLLGLNEPPEPADVADALAIAACHCFLSLGKTTAIPE
jgi:crossover junction endodeoxyribonuclease RuvC